MILHLLWDEKITGRIVKTFDLVFPGENIYLIWTWSNPPKFVQKSGNIYLIRNNADWPALDYSKFSKVLIHALDYDKIEFCKKLPKDIEVFWLVWGNDLYNLFLMGRGYKMFYKSHPRNNLLHRFGQLLLRIGYRNKRRRMIFDFLKSHDVKMVCSQEEFHLFRKYYPKESINFTNITDYFYYPVDEILGNKLIHKKANGNIILVGNSCSFTNNHEYVFDIIKDIDLKEKKIVTPLSYSGSEEYKAKVIAAGKKHFGNSYEPLTEFLPIGKYNQLMSHAQVCIYGNWRQEALGNIIIALCLGAKVFISNKYPILNTLRKMGLTVYSLEEIDEKALHSPLNKDIQEINHDIIFKFYNWNRLKVLTKEYFS